MLLDELAAQHFKRRERVLGQASEDAAVVMDGASAELQGLLHTSQEG